jgi:hypothetical protein
MDELRVPKHQAPGEVTFEGGTVRALSFFLADMALGHTGAERLSDVLNGPAPFIPVRDTQTDRVTLISRSAIVTVRTGPAEGSETAAWEETFRHEVEVELRGGERIRGAMEYALAAEHSRVLDYLCQPSTFFTVRQGEHLVLINKRFTVQVAAMDG